MIERLSTKEKLISISFIFGTVKLSRLIADEHVKKEIINKRRDGLKPKEKSVKQEGLALVNIKVKTITWTKFLFVLSTT